MYAPLFNDVCMYNLKHKPSYCNANVDLPTNILCKQLRKFNSFFLPKAICTGMNPTTVIDQHFTYTGTQLPIFFAKVSQYF